MSKRLLAAAVLSLLICLTGCQGNGGTTGEKHWAAARKSGTLEEYVKEKKGELDLDVLKGEADSAESTLGQQFKAIALMCEMEYQQNKYMRDEWFLVDYPVSGPRAEAFLAKVNTEGEAFWKSLEEAFYPYDYLSIMLAASENLEGQTLVKLLQDIPAESGYENELSYAIETWVKEHPEKIPTVGDDLIAMDYFGEWELWNWLNTYFYDDDSSYILRTDTINDGLAYINYAGASLLPVLEETYGSEQIKAKSEITGSLFCTTMLAIAVDEELKLEKPEESGLPETIEIEGKKVAAFYKNQQGEEFEGSPAPLRLLGDFMMNLPQEERPETLEDADYYLVLTPDYEYGSNYEDWDGNDIKVREVYSSTSVDLYEGGTGRFLRHLGNVMELSPSGITTVKGEEGEQYPELVGADALDYIYRNVNDPAAYISLTDNTAGLEGELQYGASIVIGNWGITCSSSEAVKEFKKGMFLYEAEDGYRLVRGKFTITNKGTREDSFMPTTFSYSEDARRETLVLVTDKEREDYYGSVNFLNLSGSLNGASLEPGETKEGELIFQVPEEVIQGGEPLSIVVFCGYQAAFYPVG